MKTLKKENEWARVKEDDVAGKLKDGWKFAKKVEWKVAEKGYVLGGKDKVVVKKEKSGAGDLREKIEKGKKGKKEVVVEEPIVGEKNIIKDDLLDGIITQEMKESRKEWAQKKGIKLRK